MWPGVRPRSDEFRKILIKREATENQQQYPETLRSKADIIKEANRRSEPVDG